LKWPKFIKQTQEQGVQEKLQRDKKIKIQKKKQTTQGDKQNTTQNKAPRSKPKAKTPQITRPH
jgi:hypothetical protein